MQGFDTCFVSNRPDEQINTSSISHHVHFVLVDRVQVFVTSIAFVIVLLVLQFRLAD